MDKSIELRFIEQENKIRNLENKLFELKNKVFELENKRNENYYQKFLEKHFSASHKKTKCGITDISTDYEHIEIKHWKNYKSALGQLLSYNYNDNKSLAAYFFGSISDEQKKIVIDLYSSKNISIYEFAETIDGIRVVEIVNMNGKKESDKEQKLFIEWLDKNIEYKENEILKLNDILELYTGNKQHHSSFSTKYKKEVEKFIQLKYKDISHDFQNIWVKNKSVRGWKHLCLKNNL